MEEVLSYLAENPMMFLATCEGDQPRVRVFAAKAVFEGRLYLATNNQKDVYRQMVKNPKVEICVLGKDNSWMRIAATAVPDDRHEARSAMMDQNPSLSRMYSVDDGVFAVLYLSDATATISAFTSAPRVIMF